MPQTTRGYEWGYMTFEERIALKLARDRHARERETIFRQEEAGVLNDEMGPEIRRQYIENGLSLKVIAGLLDQPPGVILLVLQAGLSGRTLRRRRDAHWAGTTFVIPGEPLLSEAS